MIRGAAILLLTAACSALARLLPGEREVRRLAVAWARWVVSLCGARVAVDGLWRMPPGGAVIASNHQSLLDIPVILETFPERDLVFVAKQGLHEVPLFGKSIRRIGTVFVDRENPRAALSAVREAAKAAAAGKTVVVFPEGTRSEDGSVGPFKPGAFSIAERAGVPVCLIAVSGTGNRTPKGTLRAAPGSVSLEVVKVLPAGKSSGEEENARHVISCAVERMARAV